MITQGHVITLEDNKEYICIDNIMQDNQNYLYLVSNFKPLEVRFAKQLSDDNGTSLEIINDGFEKVKVLELFKQVHNQSNN